MDESLIYYMDRYIRFARQELRMKKENGKFGFIGQGIKNHFQTLGSFASLFELTREMNEQCARATVTELSAFLKDNGMHDVTMSYAERDNKPCHPKDKTLEGLLMRILSISVNPINILWNLLSKMQMTPMSQETLRLYDYGKLKKVACKWELHWKLLHDERIKQQRNGKTSEKIYRRAAQHPKAEHEKPKGLMDDIFKHGMGGQT